MKFDIFRINQRFSLNISLLKQDNYLDQSYQIGIFN